MESLLDRDYRTFDLGGICWRHKGKIFLTSIVIVGLTLAYLSLAPRKYLSEAKVFVQIGHETVNLDPTATTGPSVAVSDTRESEINAVEQLLASRALAERVVDQFGPKVILEKKPDAGPSLGERLAGLNQYNLNPLRVYSLRDRAIESLQENLGITTGKKTSVIAVSYESESPALSRDILQSLLALAREDHLRVNRTKGSLEFFEGQTELVHDQLNKLEAELRDLKDATGLASLTSQREIQLQQLGALQADLLRAQADEDAAKAEVVRRREQVAASPEMMITEQTTGQPQTPRLVMREKLYELEVKEEELAARLKSDAPQLVTIREQIAEARKIAQQEEFTTQTTRGVNEAHRAAALALQEREAQLVALAARTGSLGEKIAAARSALKQLNEDEVKIVRMEREIDIARATYRRYADNLEVARIDQELNNAQISSLNLLQPPSYSETPASPNPKLTLVLGLALAVLCSLSVALLAEHNRRPARAAMPHPRELPAVPVSIPARPRLSEVAPANPR
jgi:uncharacterized protein involved in exopolysaccharide biosynthesis